VREENRLASEADFRRVRTEGRAWTHPMLALHARRSGGAHLRVGISVGKRLGGAVDRNRVKRRVREHMRARVKELQSGWDVVIVARPPIARATFDQIGGALDQLLGRAQLSANDGTSA
jgi:ribonuclease P protein component